MSIYFCFFSEKLFLLSRAEIPTGHCQRRTWQYSADSDRISLFLTFLSASQERRSEGIFLKRDFEKFISAIAKGWRLRHAAFVGRWHNPFTDALRPHSGGGGTRHQFEDAASCERICRGCASLSVARARQGSRMTRLKVISCSAGAFSKTLVQKYPIER